MLFSLDPVHSIVTKACFGYTDPHHWEQCSAGFPLTVLVLVEVQDATVDTWCNHVEYRHTIAAFTRLWYAFVVHAFNDQGHKNIL